MKEEYAYRCGQTAALECFGKCKRTHVAASLGLHINVAFIYQHRGGGCGSRFECQLCILRSPAIKGLNGGQSVETCVLLCFQ